MPRIHVNTDTMVATLEDDPRPEDIAKYTGSSGNDVDLVQNLIDVMTQTRRKSHEIKCEIERIESLDHETDSIISRMCDRYVNLESFRTKTTKLRKYDRRIEEEKASRAHSFLGRITNRITAH